MDIILNPILKKSNNLVLKLISSKTEIGNDENYDGYFIDSNEKEIRKILESLKLNNKSAKKIAVLGQNDEFNRRIIETCRINFLVSPERLCKKDTLKQRDSGLNHVAAKESAKNNIEIIIDFSEISRIKDKKEKALLLAKIMQNIKICRKAGCKIKIATFANTKEELCSEHELRAFAFSLGMSSQQVKEAV